MNRADVLGKCLGVEHILLNNPNGVTTKQIIHQLYSLYGIKAERKSIYNNLNAITRFLPISEKKIGNTVVYFVDKEREGK